MIIVCINDVFIVCTLLNLILSNFYNCRKYQVLEPKHEIFLSHSGAQKDFVEQLCEDLERRDYYLFFDICQDSLPIGKEFSKLIFQAIQQCQVGVVTLLNEFFERSKWPMLELAAMIKKKTILDANFIIIPIFLDITHIECCRKENHSLWLSTWHGWPEFDNRINIQDWMIVMEIFGHTTSLSYKEGLNKVKFQIVIVETFLQDSAMMPSKTRMDDSYIQGRSRLCQIRNKEVFIVQERSNICTYIVI